MDKPEDYYEEKLSFYGDKSEALRDRYDRLAYVRLLFFVLGIGGVILLWSFQWWVGILGFFGFITLFAWGVRRHQLILEQSQHAEHLAGLAAGELLALDHEFDGWDDGKKYQDSNHPYSGDLDLFGNHSLFQFLNRSNSRGGQDQLAKMLLEPAPMAYVSVRQGMIEELAGQVDWCHEFRARGFLLEEKEDYPRRLKQWVALPFLVADRPLLRAALWVIPLFFVLTLYLLFTLPVWQVGLLGLLPVALIMRGQLEKINRLHQHTAQIGKVLKHYSGLLDSIESAEWTHPELRKLQSPLQEGKGAAMAIRQLSYAVSQLDVRYNIFSFLLEISGLWSLQWMYRLDRWRQKYREALPGWLDSLAEVDALVSFANLRYNQPDWVFAILDHEDQLQADQLGHPLIAPTERVTNNIAMATDGHIHLVTGSNMAGKSTWLRTVGINIVLALAGAPVCASYFRLPFLRVWTSMRTQDALHESTSSFFAELKRLRQIIQSVDQGRDRVFFLLDEILKGTNSRDRHTGARALIRQLIQSNGAGIIATHDLELTDLGKAEGSRVENYAMEVEMREGELIFDYKLTEGVSERFNATILMAEMGIRIDDKDINLRHE